MNDHNKDFDFEIIEIIKIIDKKRNRSSNTPTHTTYVSNIPYAIQVSSSPIHMINNQQFYTTYKNL